MAPAYSDISGTTRPFVIRGYAVVDGRIGYELPGNHMMISAWGKNIFNKYYLTKAGQFLDAMVRYAGLPAAYGLTVSFKY